MSHKPTPFYQQERGREYGHGSREYENSLLELRGSGAPFCEAELLEAMKKEVSGKFHIEDFEKHIETEIAEGSSKEIITKDNHRAFLFDLSHPYNRQWKDFCAEHETVLNKCNDPDCPGCTGNLRVWK